MAKVLVSFDDVLVRRIDRAAHARGLSRSAYLAELARCDLERLTGPGTRPAAQGALARLDELFAASPPQDSTALIRAERDAR